ncbi:MAG: nitroreductase/quinone reductase family protein [Gammaproteobacteria bacterium]
MRVPEFLFAVINPVMRLLLRSPLHRIFSDSIMLITFTGRKSGRQYTTPVRYLRKGDTIRCFTLKKNVWWRNLRGGALVVLRMEGRDGPFEASVEAEDIEAIRSGLEEMFTAFPEDAVYQEVRLNKDRSPVADDLTRAARLAVMLDLSPAEQP